MSSRLHFVENIPELAAQAFELAETLCGSCRNFHGLWSYVRLARVTSGIEVGRAELESALARSFAAGRRKILIAGAADTGQLALVAGVGEAYSAEIVVSDRCATPLELCRRLSQKWSFPIAILHTSVLDLDLKKQFDIVQAHFLLHFIPPEARLQALQRLHAALRPDGSLLCLEFTGRRMTGELMEYHHSNYPVWILSELDRLDIPLPAPREAFRAQLERYAAERLTREGAFGGPDEIEALLESACFSIERHFLLDLPVVDSFKRLTTKLSKQPHFWIARPKAS